jgi:hypothetical protein
MLYAEDRSFGVRAITHTKKAKKVDTSGPKISILSPSYAKLQLQSTLPMLNSSTGIVPRWLDESEWESQTIDTTEAQQELRRLIAAWNKSGPNLEKALQAAS